MQIQRHLFRISERTLKSENAQFWWKGIFYVLSSLGVMFTLFLLLGHIYVLPNNNALSQCLAASKFQLSNDSIYYVTDKQIGLEQLKQYQSQQKFVINIPECTIIHNRNASIENEMLSFGYDQISMFMDEQKRPNLIYQNYTFYIKQVKHLRTMIFGFDNLIINQLVANNGQDSFLQQRLLVKSSTAYVFRILQQLTPYLKIILVFKVIIIYFVISIVTSLYIYGTIVAAPAVILLILKVCNYLRMDNLNDVFKLFPWIGIHAIIRDTSATVIFKQSTSQICKAMLYYFMFLYLVYYASIIFIDKFLFSSHIELGLQQLLFGFIAIFQFASIIFMRTRTFIKYYPAFHSLLVIGFLYYGQVCDFGFKKICSYAVFTISGALFAWMVYRLQIPAHTVWDPINPNTPKQQRPRAGYFPLFNLGWMKNLPDEWTMMMPLFGRQNFSNLQMSLVDHNHEELNAALGNH